jgi:putative holliday junction resolvase
MKYLGIDVGTVRVGVAIVNIDGGIPFPLGVLQRAQGRAERGLLALIKEHSPEKIVVGLPLNADGTESLQCQDVRGFCRRLSKRTSTPLVFADEYHSSEDALELSRQSGKARSEIDDLAACIILQRYLSSCE